MTSPHPLRPSNAPFKPLALHDMLRTTARRLPNKTMLIDGDRHVTFAEFDRLSDRVAAGLAGLGVVKGDRVGVFSQNCLQYELVFYGTLRTGATVTTVNAAYKEREVHHQVGNSGAKVLFVQEAMLPIVQAVRGELTDLKHLIVIGRDPAGRLPTFEDFLERAPSAVPSVRVDPLRDLAVLPYSSGTTGVAKGVMLTHQNLSANARQATQRLDLGTLREHDIVMVHLPLFHIYGMGVLMNSAVLVGATQVLMGRFEMDPFLDLLAKHRVTILYTVPPIALAMTQHPRVGSMKLSSHLRFALSGAAPLGKELQERWERATGVPAIQGYGLTEASPYTHADFLEPHLRRPGSIGMPMADTEQKVVSEDGSMREVARGETGELLLRGPQVMQGYWRNPEATAATITPDGWLRTGDIVRLDSDGYAWVADRLKELIKYKGFQVPPAELEALILEHPAVADVAVVGKPDEEAGEVPKAFVVVKKGAHASAQDIIDFVSGKVAGYKRVKEVEFVDLIPKNPSGKILRRLLRDKEREKAGA